MDMSFNDPGGFATGDAALGLRPLTWDGLCARIAAAQELRRALTSWSGLAETGHRVAATGDAVNASGSFHRQTATFIASGIAGVSPQIEAGEHLVNPNSSVNGKANPGTLESLNTGVRSGRTEA
jgi:hypothetical protein